MRLLLVLMLGMGAGGAAFLLFTSSHVNNLAVMKPNTVQRLDLSGYADAPPAKPLRLLFLHHSCGGQLLAAAGSDVGTNAIYTTNPNGGGLQRRLEQAGYEVHQAAYGSSLGEHTDLFDWLPKFRQQMDHVLACDQQDTSYRDDRRNAIVLFKSCFPNNNFVSAGTPPGDPNGPALTVWNAKATFTALLDEFRQYPRVLFVCITAPPLASETSTQPLWKRWAKRLLGRRSSVSISAPLAREFNNWLSGQEGWLKDSQLTNVVVFDYYDILTGSGVSNTSLLSYWWGDG